MDRFLASFPAEDDGDLALCRDHGAAYQQDRSNLVNYDAAYYAKCASYEDQAIARAINAGREKFVFKWWGPGRMVDIGIGSGEFIRKRPNTYGHDVNPVAIEWLKRNDLWAGRLHDFCAFSMWDVVEHLETPEDYLQHVPLHGFAFFSLPIFYGLGAIRTSKHYRPGEHLQYFTEEGFVCWMGRHGFLLLDTQTFEIDAGRESIYSFAFKRIAWARRES